MTTRRVASVSSLIIALLAGVSELSAQGYQVVVNAANPVSSMRAREVSRIFQKRVTRWEDGQVVLVVDLLEDSPVRAAFSQAVHRRSVNDIKAYWQRQVFSGRGTPPDEMRSDTEVLAYVARNVNAIGYVSANAPLNSDVKVFEVR